MTPAGAPHWTSKFLPGRCCDPRSPSRGFFPEFIVGSLAEGEGAPNQRSAVMKATSRCAFGRRDGIAPQLGTHSCGIRYLN